MRITNIPRNSALGERYVDEIVPLLSPEALAVMRAPLPPSTRTRERQAEPSWSRCVTHMDVATEANLHTRVAVFANEINWLVSNGHVAGFALDDPHLNRIAPRNGVPRWALIWYPNATINERLFLALLRSRRAWPGGGLFRQEDSDIVEPIESFGD